MNRSPLLINKIVAERLSDKIQVVMVPSDGKFFFASDVFKSAANNPIVKQEMDSEQEPAPANRATESDCCGDGSATSSVPQAFQCARAFG